MLWFPYFILGYIALALQIGLKAHLTIWGAWPNLVLLAVIFIAINAPREAALLGAFGLGVLQDLTTAQTLGLFAFSYGLIAIFTVNTQQVVYKGHPLTHFSVALFGGIVCGLVMIAHGLIRRTPSSPMTWFYVAVYTAVMAPLVLGGLNRIRRVFSFQRPRRRLRL